jgi:hypothetical protein
MKKTNKIIVIVDTTIGIFLMMTGILGVVIFDNAQGLLWLCLAGIYLIVKAIPPDKASGSKKGPVICKSAMVIKTGYIGIIVDYSDSHGLCYALVFPNLKGYYGRKEQLTVHWFDPEEITIIYD